MVTLDEALQEAQRNGRICPMPDAWKRLYEMLPGKRREGGKSVPALPLILAAWTVPGVYKIARLREHIEWAAEHGALEEVYEFLKGLPENEWHHGRDR